MPCIPKGDPEAAGAGVEGVDKPIHFQPLAGGDARGRSCGNSGAARYNQWFILKTLILGIFGVKFHGH